MAWSDLRVAPTLGSVGRASWAPPFQPLGPMGYLCDACWMVGTALRPTGRSIVCHSEVPIPILVLPFQHLRLAATNLGTRVRIAATASVRTMFQDYCAIDHCGVGIVDDHDWPHFGKPFQDVLHTIEDCMPPEFVKARNVARRRCVRICRGR